jgi:heat shock transcription factor
MFMQPHRQEQSAHSTAAGFVGVLARGRTASTAVPMDENQRLRRSNKALLQELAHMRKLYNII